jgi:membrane protease YdiL (CAAX protease family)
MEEHATSAISPAARVARQPRVWHLYLLLLAAQVLIVVIVLAGAGAIAASRGLIDDHTPPAQVNAAVGQIMRSPQVALVGLCASAFVGLILAVLVGAISPRPFAQRLRLGRGRLSTGELAVSTIGFLALSLGFDALLQHLPGYDDSAVILLRDLMRDRSVASLPFVVAVVAFAAPLSEELLYRGALQTRLSERYGRRIGLVIASLCFGLAHMDVVQGLFAVFAGLYLGWICDLAGSCRASILAHCANNLLAAVSAVWWANVDVDSVWAIAGVLAISAACVALLWRRTRERAGAGVAGALQTAVAG